MNENYIPSRKSAMDFGSIIGGVLTCAGVIFYFSHAFFSEQLALISYLIMGFGIFLGVKRFRGLMPGGLITYSKALGYGTLLMLFASIIYGFFVYLLYKVFDPNLLTEYLSFLETGIKELGMKKENEEAMLTIIKMSTPFSIGLNEIFGKTLIGFIFSLFISLFLSNSKKVNTKDA